MHIEFDETFPISPVEAFEYFKTPQDWQRIFGAFGEITERGEGWYTVPMRRSPFPLIAKITVHEPGERVAWDLRGFWKGNGEVQFGATDEGTHITGFETIALPGPFGLGRLLERLAEARFVAVWESGWRKLSRISTS